MTPGSAEWWQDKLDRTEELVEAEGRAFALSYLRTNVRVAIKLGWTVDNEDEEGGGE